ncbi:MAG: cyclase family protein [Planctomycetota bacterium]|nr:cyclase family protein [Planctomycetota bacterium]MDA1105867.1 cyclase family protein [Planctomycetota bacterium]
MSAATRTDGVVNPGDLIDISSLISPRLVVWPGDTAFTREVLLDTARGDNITLGTTRSTVHLGSHADAPRHYGKPPARTMEQQPIDLYVGPCDVLDVGRPGTRSPDGWRAGLELLRGRPTTPRVLLRTSSYPDPEVWYDDFTSLAPEMIDSLADMGVRLVCVDAPSVDDANSKSLPTHARCLARDVSIIEGLRLEGVESTADGARWELIALPLKLEGSDGSPVRAVLRRLA